MSGAPMASTPLVRVDPDGSTNVVTEPLHFPNGAVIYGDTLVVAETFGHRLSAFDIDADGNLSARRDWASFGPLPDTTDITEALGLLTLGPDGICLDAEGAVWVADALGNRAVRVREGGEIVQEISTGDTGVYAAVLGGADGRTLYLCTAPGFAEHERRDTREAKVLATRVDVPGACTHPAKQIGEPGGNLVLRPARGYQVRSTSRLGAPTAGRRTGGARPRPGARRSHAASTPRRPCARRFCRASAATRPRRRARIRPGRAARSPALSFRRPWQECRRAP
jgi:hypothetical protein